MEFAGRLGPFPAFGSIGFAGAVFDNATGATAFSVGDIVSGSWNNNFGNIIWKDNKLSGWSFGQSGTPTPQTVQYPLTLGTPLTSASFNTGLTFAVPGAHNAPSAWCPSAWDTQSGLILSYNTAGNPTAGFWNYAASINAGSGYSLPYNSNLAADGVIPYNGVNYVYTGYAGGVGTTTIQATDFLTYSTTIATQLTNPPASSVDLNALINLNTTPAPQSCYGGWLWFFDTALTIGSTVLNGYGIYITPDWSSYQIIQIIPTDTTSAGWAGLLGTKVGKFDQSGILWLKAGGNAGTIFSGVPPTRQIVQTFPPIALPAPMNDTELMLNAYKEPQI